ncbi:WAP four-disulfide core domain protein 3 isoform X1 [Eleutherodactylus coqui]|uniref:WAP four-disulfide core domain protein 3 isoform X1 n=1 Tax=Eleutherodactylus coqui TaxID=57060 RepID=UPI0034635F61
MMKISRLQASFLGLLLCSVILMVSSSSSYDTDKPGECPKERRYTSSGRESNENFCKNDGECDGVKKCCSDNDFKFCKMPAAERPGSCPNPSEIPSNTNDDMCTSDSECAPKAKCCTTKGGNTCWPSVGEKNGVCPSPNRVCVRGVRPSCNSDTGCPNVEKCCSYNCSSVCMPPENSNKS